MYLVLEDDLKWFWFFQSSYTLSHTADLGQNKPSSCKTIKDVSLGGSLLTMWTLIVMSHMLTPKPKLSE